MRKPSKYIAAATIVLCATACSSGNKPADSQDGELPPIAVSIEPLRAMLEPLAAGRYRVVTVMDRGADPESFEPSMSQRVAADRAAALFVMNAMPFERVLAEAAGERVADVAAGIEPVYGTHSHDAHHGHHSHDCGEVDPHYWTSARNAMTITRNMARSLCDLDPENATLYTSRRDSMLHRYAMLDSTLGARLANAPSRAFMVWHPSLSYFARDYGLHQVAVGAENKEVSPARIRNVVDAARTDSVRVFLYQSELDTRQAASLNEAAGTRLVQFNPLDYGWEEQLLNIADEIARQ